MKLRTLAGAALVLALCCSCSTINTLTGISVNQKTIAVAVQAFDVAEVSAAKYVALPACKTGQATASNACKDPATAATVVTAVMKARSARDSLWSASKAAPDGVGLTAAYKAFVAATDAIKSDIPKK